MKNVYSYSWKKWSNGNEDHLNNGTFNLAKILLLTFHLTSQTIICGISLFKLAVSLKTMIF